MSLSLINEDMLEVADPRTGEVTNIPSVLSIDDVLALTQNVIRHYQHIEVPVAQKARLMEGFAEIASAAKTRASVYEQELLALMESEGAKAKRIGRDLYKVEEKVDYVVTDVDELMGFFTRVKESGDITPEEYEKAVAIVPAKPKFDMRTINALVRRGGVFAEIDRLRAQIVASRRLRKDKTQTALKEGDL